VSGALDQISVVVPVLNDREGMSELLAALAEQRRAPGECVVVDGGSTDGTVQLLQTWRGPFPLRIISRPGRNIAAARNAGIRAARYDWIACTDAGCRPAPGWLAAIDAARGSADFVAGVVAVEAGTPLQRVLALTHYPSAEELVEPPAWIRATHRLFGRGYVEERSGGAYIAFSKATWLAVGGFPEGVYAGEDRAFTSAVVHRGFRTLRVPEAAVRWNPPATWLGNARMFYTYSRGDIRAPGRRRHALRLVAWVAAARFIAGDRTSRLLLLAGAGAYLALPVHRARRARLPLRDWWRIPVAVAVKDLSQIAGAARGLVDAARGVPQPPPRAVS